MFPVSFPILFLISLLILFLVLFLIHDLMRRYVCVPEDQLGVVDVNVD